MAKKQFNPTLDLSIVTVNWNVTDKLVKCIDSVLATCNDIEYEMFIIDNNSSDEDFNKIIKNYKQNKQLTFITNDKNEGALVINKIQDRIKGRYLLILGPDTILKNNCVKNLIYFLDNNKRAGAASGKLLNPDGSPQMYYFNLWTLSMSFYLETIIGEYLDKLFFSYRKKKVFLGEELDVDSLVEIEQPCAACFIVRPEILLEDGFIIDPIFPYYYNDVDLCKRVKDKGYKIFLVPNAEVIHDHGSSFKKAKIYWKTVEYIKSQVLYFKKYYPNKVILLKNMIFLDSLTRVFIYSFINKDEFLVDKRSARLKIVKNIFKW